MLHECRGERQMATVVGFSVVYMVHIEPCCYYLNTRTTILLRRLSESPPLHEIVFTYFIVAMVKKTKSSIVSCEGEPTVFLDLPAEHNVPPTTPGTSAAQPAADARETSKLESHESTTSYAEARRSIN
jgi:hypothetical protein